MPRKASKQPADLELLAQRIGAAVAEDLFVNGAGEQADHLVLTKDGRDLGGWAKACAADRIAQAVLPMLERELEGFARELEPFDADADEMQFRSRWAPA